MGGALRTMARAGVAAAVVLVAAVFVSANFLTEYWWFDALGQAGVFWRLFAWPWGVRLAGTVLFASFIYLNLRLTQPAVARAVFRFQERVPSFVSGAFVRRASLVVSVAFGFLASEALAQQCSKRVAGHHSYRGADGDEQAERAERLAKRVAGLAVDDPGEDQGGYHGPDRIDDDAFPAQDVAHALHRPYDPEERTDHRWSGDHQECAELDCHWRLEADQEPGGQRDQQPGHDAPDRHQAPDGGTDALEVSPSERQAALEEDEADRQRYCRMQQVGADQLARLDEPKYRAHHEADKQQRQDRRQVDAPGEPLRGSSQRHYHCEYQSWIIHSPCRSRGCIHPAPAKASTCRALDCVHHRPTAAPFMVRLLSPRTARP